MTLDLVNTKVYLNMVPASLTCKALSTSSWAGRLPSMTVAGAATARLMLQLPVTLLSWSGKDYTKRALEIRELSRTWPMRAADQ